MTVRLFLFGSPAIEVDGEMLALPFERRSQLLVFLALRRSWVGRAELATLLWPEQANKLAYMNLRKILHRLQRSLWAQGIEVEGGALRFEGATDVFAFDSAIRDQRIADALPLRTGELLAGFDDDQNEAWSSWLNFERERLRLAWRDAALSRLAVDINMAEAIELSTRLLAADPLDEVAVRAKMSWLERGAQNARAREVYREFADRLARDLGLTPGAEVRALHDSLGAAAGSLATAASPAPTDFDADFVGRRVELRRIGSLLAQADCRLLCVIGPGGVGKTRLAKRAMHEFAPRFSDGAAFIPLEDITSPNEVGGRLARELCVVIAGGDEPLKQVVAFLRERHLLLVLDNFEHLAADASILDTLTRECPRLQIIATSRVRLALSIEWLLPLTGLPCPEPEDHDRIEAFDAVRLFIQVAQRVNPALVPATEAASIADICRQLEGLPLALELAASWTRVLTCAAIAAELRHGTELLRAVDPGQPSRHASIEIVFEQSWRLLSASERDALSRLSVFHGAFAAEAARAIAGAPLAVVGALVDKSLLRKDGARLFMHPLVQQLSALHLGQGSVRDLTEKAHAQYFHRLLARSRRTFNFADLEALHRVDTDFENCRVAWRWSVQHHAGDELAKSAMTLLQFCDQRGRLDEGLAMVNDAIESSTTLSDPKLTALLASVAASFEFLLDRYGDAMANATRALAASRPFDHDTKLQSFKVLGSCSFRLGRHAEAKGFFEKGLRHAQASADPHNVGSMLTNLALVEKVMGNYPQAQRLSIQSLLQHQRLGDVAEEALALNNLGALSLDQQDYNAAGVYLREGLVICEQHGLVRTRGLILVNLAEIAVKTGDEAAEAHAKRALEVAEESGNRANACMVKQLLVQLAVQRGDLTAARSDLRSSLKVAIAIGRPTLVIAGVALFAAILAAQGQSECARLAVSFAAEHPTAIAPQRDELRARLAKWHPADSRPRSWPELELDELVHRIVVESDLAYAPLIASLRGMD